MKAIEEEGSDTTQSETQRLTNGNIEEIEENKKSIKQKTRWQRIFPWIVCATSFVVQFFVLGFYKSFGPVYVKLLEPKPSGFGGNPVSTCK